MAVSYEVLARDLRAETAELDPMLEPLDDQAWELETPAPGWRIKDHVSHLAYFDHAAMLAGVDPAHFEHERAEARAHPAGITERIRARYADLTPPELLTWFRQARAQLLDAFVDLDPSTRVPWYGLDMSLASCLTARIMETWAHGLDIADALSIQRAPTSALRQVAHLGVRSFANSFTTNGLPVPDAPMWVDLRAPDGDHWTWGDASAADHVVGDALDFCRVVTQRLHVVDAQLTVHGEIATRWMAIAQAFAGPPGAGRTPAGSQQT